MLAVEQQPAKRHVQLSTIRAVQNDMIYAQFPELGIPIALRRWAAEKGSGQPRIENCPLLRAEPRECVGRFLGQTEPARARAHFSVSQPVFQGCRSSIQRRRRFDGSSPWLEWRPLKPARPKANQE